MYKLKDGITWENVKNAIEFVDITNKEDKFDNYFEKVELPKVELKQKYKNGLVEELTGTEIDCVNIDELIDEEFEITKFNEKGLGLSICIGKSRYIKSISEFNEKCAQLFGFELIEAKEDK